MLLAVFKLSKATYVRTTAINTPVLVMGGERDLIVPAQVLDQTAAQYWHAEVVRVPKADHMIFSGDFLSTTMTYIDEWSRERTSANARYDVTGAKGNAVQQTLGHAKVSVRLDIYPT